jgi:isoquinoline 1-oxidoreductase beta subunit
MSLRFKDCVVEQSNFGDFTVARMSDMPAFDIHLVPNADAPPGRAWPVAAGPAFANVVPRLTNKPLRQIPFNLT